MGNMEIKYQNSLDDYQAYYEDVNRTQKKSQRDSHYLGLSWYLSVLGLMIYVSMKYEENFLACLFAVAAVTYLWEHWSFERKWASQTMAYAQICRSHPTELRLEEAGITERFAGVILFVPWDQIREYSMNTDLVIVHFLADRAFLIPLRRLSARETEQVLEVLEQHKLPRREIPLTHH